MTEITKDLKKFYRNRVDRLKSKCLSLEGQGHEKLGANKFGVTTQGIPITTRTRLLKKLYVATSSKYVATQSKNQPREQVATKKQEATTEAATKTESSVVTKLSMSQQRDQFRPEFWGTTTQLMK